MPIITLIGRRSWSVRLIIWGVYATLSIGAVTMVYPFLMMLSLSLSSDADYKENRLLPRYVYDDDALFRKFANIKYIELEQFNRRHGTAYADFGYSSRFNAMSARAVNFPHIVPARFDLSDPRVRTRIDDYLEWKRLWLPEHWVFTQCLYNTDRAKASVNPLLDRYVAFLLARYKSLDGINDAYFMEARQLSQLLAIREKPMYRTYLPQRGRRFDDWLEFKKGLAAEDLEFIDIVNPEYEWASFLESRFGSEEKLNEVLGLNVRAIAAAPLPCRVPDDGPSEAQKELRRAWIDFVRDSCPLRYLSIGDADAKFRRFLLAKYGDIGTINGFYETQFGSFEDLTFPLDISYNKTFTSDIYAFVAGDDVSPEDIAIRGPRWDYMKHIEAKYATIEALNDAHSLSYAAWDEVRLPRRIPLGQTPAELNDWKTFVTTACPVDALMGSFDHRAAVLYLESRYGSITELNKAWGTSYRTFGKVQLPRAGEMNDAQREDFRRMLVDQAVPVFTVAIPETVSDGHYREFLAGRYASLADYNRALRLYSSWESVREPADEVEWADFSAKRAAYKERFFTGNYRAVVDYMAVHGRAFFNTVILCTAMIISALTVNPLCAYALSRFQLSFANGILLFLLATMAFPLAVTQIPNFLLLKELHLLNTYWALILPAVASGYSIFLLKGFFDSLPQELFEAGLIDGASEVQMFYRIALPLTKPILAVTALGAFTAAYGQFMWAFVVCQDPKYYTIMVWLYDYQSGTSTPLVMAALVLASIPTLLVFLVAQKVILRGIVVPQMK